jgi:hypothetical protein
VAVIGLVGAWNNRLLPLIALNRDNCYPHYGCDKGDARLSSPPTFGFRRID